MEGETAKATYLYCFAMRDFVTGPLEWAGVDGRAQVTLRAHGKLVAVVSEVPLEEFAGAQAEANMSDLDWVGPRALRHEYVVEQVMQRSPVFPVRFATLFSSVDRVVQMLATHHDEVVAFADRVTGKEEWAVKAYLERRRTAQALAAEAVAAQGQRLSGSPGARFLQQQRLQTQAGARVTEWLEATRRRLRQELQRWAVDLIERTITASGAAEDRGEMVLNWAVLVPRAAVLEMISLVGGLNTEWGLRGLTVQCTGPLPPYSFTPTLGEPGAAREGGR